MLVLSGSQTNPLFRGPATGDFTWTPVMPMVDIHRFGKTKANQTNVLVILKKRVQCRWCVTNSRNTAMRWYYCQIENDFTEMTPLPDPMTLWFPNRVCILTRIIWKMACGAVWNRMYENFLQICCCGEVRTQDEQSKFRPLSNTRFVKRGYKASSRSSSERMGVIL